MHKCVLTAFVMDIGLFRQMLDMDSTSGREREFAEFLAARLQTDYNKVETFEVGDGTLNVLISWGEPEVVFCSHLDTVPPYIEPSFSEDGAVVCGRGTCDAKGQIFAMWEACKVLESKGYEGFGLLLLAGEETGSYGAKAFRGQYSGAEWVIVGEPTDNCMASAAKGTKAFEVTFAGQAFHSGYPQYGISAVELFNDFMNALRSVRFPIDETLGETTWNVGRLVSDNPQNILSDSLTCRVYFRTTFESDEMVCNIMKNIAGEDARLRFGRPRVQDGSDVVGKDVAQWQRAMSVTALGGDTPSRFETFEGFPSKPVAFGSDAPQLTNFRRKVLCGPGSILVAHRADEHVLLSEIESAVSTYVKMFEYIKKRPSNLHDTQMILNI